MHIELTKKEIKALKKLRHEIHLMGPLGTIKDMFTRSEPSAPTLLLLKKSRSSPLLTP